MSLRKGEFYGTRLNSEDRDLEVPSEGLVETINAAEHDNITILAKGAPITLHPHGWKIELPVEVKTDGDESIAKFDLAGLERIDVRFKGTAGQTIKAHLRYYAGITGLNF